MYRPFGNNSANSSTNSQPNKSPEQNLCLAVIGRACHDIDHYVQLKEHDEAKYGQAKNARTWLLNLTKSQPKVELLTCYWMVESSFKSHEIPGVIEHLLKIASQPLLRHPDPPNYLDPSQNPSRYQVSEATLLQKVQYQCNENRKKTLTQDQEEDILDQDLA